MELLNEMTSLWRLVTRMFLANLIWFLLASRDSVTAVTRGKAKVSQQKALLEDLMQKDKYTKEDSPNLYNATHVMLGVSINSFYTITESNMDYQVSFDLRQKWNDPRLKYDPPNDRLTDIKLGDGMWEKIWVPDTFFRNEKKANFHDVTVNNRMLRLNQNGTLLYVAKISAVFSCPMELQKYPLDTQKCPIIFESFGYTTDTMDFEWTDEIPIVELGKNRQLPQFTLVGYIKSNCTQNYTGGIYPCLQVSFVLRRDIGYYLIQVYVPSILIVILSWVSFWINIESSPARVSIGLLTVLTTTTMSAGARASLPRVSYIKAIDVWMIICLIFVFASLIEYAVVNVIARKKNKKPATPQAAGGAAAPGLVNETPMQDKVLKDKLCKCMKTTGAAPGAAKHTDSDGKRNAQNIDKLSRQCFPLAFILFNVVYWTVYAIPEDTSNDDIEGTEYSIGAA